MAGSRELPESGAEWLELRERRGLARAGLARRCSLDASTIWALEHDRPVADRTRLLVAAALGLDVFGPVEEAAVA